MLIADTFKLDRLYAKEFRKLLAVSFHKRSSQSIKNIINPPARSLGLTSHMSKSRRIAYSKELDPLPQHRNSEVMSPSQPRQCQSYETPKHERYNDEEPKPEEKVLSFLDSNMGRIHTTKRDVSIRKRLKFNSRCSTETNVSLAKIEPAELENNLQVSKKDCGNKEEKLVGRSIQPQMYNRKLRYMRLPKPSKFIEDKENKCLEFCPWDCHDNDELAD
jgi:hypothetical protein